MDLCHLCKEIKESAHTDELTGHHYCESCVVTIPSPAQLWYQWLFDTVPFRPGDAVECRTAGVIYEGVGVVEEVHFDPEHGATPVYPMFSVRLTKKAKKKLPNVRLYTERCLTRIANG